MLRSTRSGRVVLTVLLFVCCLLLSSCVKSKVTKANFDKLTQGMTLAEVEAILGKGTKDEGGDGSNVAGQFGVNLQPAAGGKGGDIYVWEAGDKKITLHFVNGKAQVLSKSGF